MNSHTEPIEVEAEVVPAEETQVACVPPPPRPPGSTLQRLNYAFGPVIAGLIIDFIDLATFGPVGLFLGPPVGGLAGYWLGRALGLSQRHALYCGLAAGLYCTVPFTEVLPIATIVGACVRFWESGRRPFQPPTNRQAGRALQKSCGRGAGRHPRLV